MAYIGGTAVFGGPVLGAILITLLQSGVSLLSNSWLVYVGVLFIAMVIYAPTGLAGMLMAHGPVRQAGRLHSLIVPYLRLVVPGLALVLGFVGVVELLSFLTIGAAQGKKLVLFGNPIDVKATMPWLVSWGSLLLGGLWLKFEAGHFHRVWENLTVDLRPRR
jgi:branched-chain amino acid transport system permease protein